ncbi:hypothetical protein GF354_02280 [Candidatus Peregrinibacteria bacterium]|nr:hypothetical protein [Candidatus Peregrinibacteria bacterium]
MFDVVYTKKARKDLRTIDLKISQKIIEKVFHYSQQKNPLKFAKKLKGSILGDYRFRIGNYRVIFDVDKKGNIKILLILSVKHRREVYRNM